MFELQYIYEKETGGIEVERSSSLLPKKRWPEKKHSTRSIPNERFKRRDGGDGASPAAAAAALLGGRHSTYTTETVEEEEEEEAEKGEEEIVAS